MRGTPLQLDAMTLSRPLAAGSRFWALIVLAAAAAVGLCGADIWFYKNISEQTNTPDALDRDFYSRTRVFWEATRIFGSAGGGIVAATAILLLHSRGWRMGLACVLSVTAADLTGYLAQGTIGRLRPNHAMVAEDAGPLAHLAFMPPLAGLAGNTPTSLPSGEATAACALAAALALVWPRLTILVFALAALNCIARLVHGAHFVSDVAAGAALGMGLVWALLPRATRIVARLTQSSQRPLSNRPPDAEVAEGIGA